MGLGEVVGGAAIAGMLVLFGLAVMTDDDPQSLTSEQSVVLSPSNAAGTPTTTAAAESTTTATETTDATTPATTEPAPTTEPPPAETDPPEPTDATTTEPPVTAPTDPPTSTSTASTLPRSQRAAIAVRVLNAGVEEGAARFVSGVLKQSGFEPLEPRDAPAGVDGTIVMYGPGLAAEGATVNLVVETDPESIVEAPDGDPNWAAFGDGIDVLVLLGQN